MSKGRTREIFAVTRSREGDLGGGDIDRTGCEARVVKLASSRGPDELRAMGATYLYLDGTHRIVLRRAGHVVAELTTEVAALRRCIAGGIRFEADLSKLTVRGGLAVRVRPVSSR